MRKDRTLIDVLCQILNIKYGSLEFVSKYYFELLLFAKSINAFQRLRIILTSAVQVLGLLSAPLGILVIGHVV